ncbi:MULTISPECIES: alpha/beta hydrolase [unclassified Pseudomonas]|uniref:alpha/beta hydrolase n=1 Tax=unclassified Pseudomonas TaxID=196821 RepID=UPI002AC9C6D7|nr:MULTISPECIES: alpha/beta hydrolase [unclassified Pseudomonas]MEB0040411.1 alpha/beta hydrolase [Pseudomonas sp. MH10]MEB0078241.1 alpha/beta hydrolase [Pseudomonas sp. MH10out]MEB0091600.1 alpha/beta hydrolase [Pseudomonas sp. CCI4.2]MEB0099997.1 alpha/beta hydrolase [Pseudomonas sp. CCI3.2]MEB0120912.1 alpha/beta hydrolase [Pseudomonas sp. CCI1.2]
MTWFLDLRADSVGGIPASEVIVRQGYGHYPNFDELVRQARGHDVLFATHGFNVNRNDGIESLTGWERLLELGPNTLFVGVLWPGDSRWVPVLDYPFEDSEAITSAGLLAAFVDRHFGAATSLSFVSHSLGARVILETITQMKLPVTQAILMAGAINDNCLNTQYKATAGKLKTLSILASLEDHVLAVAFPLGNPLAGVVDKGHPYWQGALGRDGPDLPCPDNVDPHWEIPNEWKYDHSDYLGGIPPKLLAAVDLPPARTFRLQSKPAWSAGFVSYRFRKGLGR